MQNMLLGEPTNLTIKDWMKSDQWKRAEDVENIDDECEKNLARRMKVMCSGKDRK